MIFADPPRTDAPTGVVESTCFRQVEFAGVLRGTDHETEARKLVDFLISARFQNELPLNLFVYPARTDATLPPEFTKFAVVARATRSRIDPADDRRQPATVAGRVDDHRAALNRLPRWFIAVVAAAPVLFITSVLRVAGGDAAVDHVATCDERQVAVRRCRRDHLVHRVAGRSSARSSPLSSGCFPPTCSLATASAGDGC